MRERESKENSDTTKGCLTRGGGTILIASLSRKDTLGQLGIITFSKDMHEEINFTEYRA